MKTISRYIMTLALLLTAVTGAWATDEVLLTTVTATGQTTYSQSPDGIVTVTLDNISSYGGTWGWLDNGSVTVEAAQGYTITRCVFKQNPNSQPNRVIVDDQAPFTATMVPNIDGGTDVSAATSTGEVRGADFMNGISIIEVYGYLAEPPIEVTPVEGKTNEWTFTMPGSDVVLTPQYAPAAQWAKVENVEQLPAAAEGVIAGTDAPLIVEGTVATGQGIVMYAVTSTNQATAPELTAFSATVPTAKDIADEGADVLVWYYIQGADTPDGQQATADNTFNNSDICTTPLKVSVRSNKFDLALKAANANTIDATQASKGTVSVNGTDKTGDITEGKLKAVKMGSEVKLKANNGYKFRKVEVKKTGSAVLAPALENGATVVIICNWGYGTTTFTYTNNGGTFSGQASGYDAEYFNNGLELNGKNLSFGTWNVDNSDYLSVGITFNTESSAYSYTGKGQDFVSFTISVNGTDVTSQLTEAK